MKYTKEIVEEICNYLREGDTQKIACRKAHISHTTFHEWINEKTEFAEAIKKAKEDFNDTILGKLEETLWRRAQGYEATETEVEYTSTKEGTPQIKSRKTKVKHIQPDTGALIFALTNVAPEKWKNRQTQDVRSEVTAKVDAQVQRYDPKDFTEDEILSIADQLQEAEHNKLKREKEEGE